MGNRITANVCGTATGSTLNPPRIGHGGLPLLRQDFSPSISVLHHATQSLTEELLPESRLSLFSADSFKRC